MGSWSTDRQVRTIQMPQTTLQCLICGAMKYRKINVYCWKHEASHRFVLAQLLQISLIVGIVYPDTVQPRIQDWARRMLLVVCMCSIPNRILHLHRCLFIQSRIFLRHS
ncbi:hypothetical protein HMPREF3227_01800 [Corynebacterium sp. CMW7794]|nr:hypothetical protein HMPREF0307_01137 [Corynebacterium sp. DNF00584]KXI17049.1 hypothetical protein HMPREF3227_01800 [Corynebacterium sp. CMW7794]